ncbi:MAG TPA: hypothetical protein VGQ04_01045 [Chitinophagaceae bacterium]|jgi:hypothetical protein|nr:hypothetical protein [Chitinophagaceae bacterium]
MAKPLFWSLIISSLALITGCKQKENEELSLAKVNPAVKKFILRLDPPFESSNNYESDGHINIGFILMDSIGNIIKPVQDTVTKTGPHLDYDTLPAGLYTYTMRTVFGEYKKGEFILNRNMYESFWLDDVYHYTDSLTEKKILDADSIKIVYAENNDGPFHIFSFFKVGQKYKTGYNIFDRDSYGCYVLNRKYDSERDSSAVINSIMKFHFIISGTENMAVQQDYHGLPDYEFSNTYYIKADSIFFYSENVNNKYFEDGYKQFKNSFFQRK